MPNRRELTDRNRQEQTPGPPIDFCQGLPFKVRWMGRDAQTGRDLVQFPDGSIVRAGKRIFSGNCPRGTMVDVVDCGANGMIVIDWRDAEIREPLIIPEVPENWLAILDGNMVRFNSSLPFYNAANLGTYLRNVKGGESVLFVAYGLGVSNWFDSVLFDGVDGFFWANIPGLVPPQLQEKGVKPEILENLGSYNQVWLYASNEVIPQASIELIAKAKKMMLFGNTSVGGDSIESIAQQKYNASFFGNEKGVEYLFDDTDTPYISEGVKILDDSLTKGVSPLLGGSAVLKVSVSAENRGKIILTTFCRFKVNRAEPDMPIEEANEDVPTILVLR